MKRYHGHDRKTTGATLLKKPLRDHLTGLLNRVDLLPDDRMKQVIIDCATVILIEVARHDQAARRLLQ